MEDKYKDKLHNVMISRNWSQKKISDELGCSEAHVSRLLAGTHDPSKPLAKLIDLMVADQSVAYGVTKIIEGLTPEEAKAIEIMRECPEALAVVKMMGDMDRQEQSDIQSRVAEKKLLTDLMKERANKSAA